MNNRIKYTVNNATISDKIYFRADDIVGVDFQTFKYVLFTYNMGSDFHSTLEYNENSGVCSVPSGGWGKLDIKNLTDERYISEKHCWTFDGTLRQAQQEIVDKILVGDKLYSGLIQAPCGFGKCKPVFSKVLTNKGVLSFEELKNIYKDTKVFTGDTYENIIAFEPSGQKDIIEIQTDIGSRVRGAETHPILCWDANTATVYYKTLKEINKNDYVIGSYGSKLFGTEEIEDPYLAGLLAGDGGLTLNNTISFTNMDKELLDYCKKAFVKRGLKVNVYQKNNNKAIDLTVRDSKFYKEYGIDLGLNCLSILKNPSKKLRSLNEEQTKLFIRGLFDTDGCANLNRTIEYCSSSEELAFFVFTQLLNLGILCTIKQKKTKSKDTYVITITSSSEVNKYMDLIGFGLANKRDIILNSKYTTRSSTKGNFIGLNKVFYEIYQKNKDKNLYGDSNLFYNYKNCNISIYKMQTLVNHLQTKKVEYPELLNFTLNKYCSKVVSIKNIGQHDTYDIQVANTPSYVSEGVINHNSYLGGYLISNYGKSTIIICHTKLLAYQWYDLLKEKIIGAEIGFIGDGKESIKPITVAIYKSLVTRMDKIKGKFEVSLTDEAHLAPAETFSKVINGIDAKVKLALTATPIRKDGLHVVFNDYFGPNRIVARDEGKLQPSVQIVKTSIPFTVLNPQRDWTKQLTKLGSNDQYLNLIATTARDKISHKRCLLILSERIDMLEKLNLLIPRSVLLVGSTPAKQREDILENAGIKYDAILTTKIFDEGISCHRLDTIMLTCPNNNYAKLEQRIGRILRAHPDKQEPLIVDFWLAGHIVNSQQKSRQEWYQKNNYPILKN